MQLSHWRPVLFWRIGGQGRKHLGQIKWKRMHIYKVFQSCLLLWSEYYPQAKTKKYKPSLPWINLNIYLTAVCKSDIRFFFFSPPPPLPSFHLSLFSKFLSKIPQTQKSIQRCIFYELFRFYLGAQTSKLSHPRPVLWQVKGQPTHPLS